MISFLYSLEDGGVGLASELRVGTLMFWGIGGAPDFVSRFYAPQKSLELRARIYLF